MPRNRPSLPSALLAAFLLAPPSARADDCDACHVDSDPSSGDWSLRPCTRPEPEPPPVPEGPQGVLTLDQVKSRGAESDDLYGSVLFDHGAHADWMVLSTGCVGCHHMSAPQGPFPACRLCHPAGSPGQNLAMPGLKGAYHRQCLGCHREWTHENGCDNCHLPNDAGSVLAGATPDDIVGTRHPPIPPPRVRIYDTSFPAPSGSTVGFDHEGHTRMDGVACVDCHQGQSCARCHDATSRAERPKPAHHAVCNTCHDTASACMDCHLMP